MFSSSTAKEWTIVSPVVRVCSQMVLLQIIPIFLCLHSYINKKHSLEFQAALGMWFWPLFWGDSRWWGCLQGFKVSRFVFCCFSKSHFSCFLHLYHIKGTGHAHLMNKLSLCPYHHSSMERCLRECCYVSLLGLPRYLSYACNIL